MEWYDFSLYGIFAVYIAHSFFPTSSQFVGLLMVFLTFSVSFIARPAGSLIFGYIGDEFGKHYSVNISVWCMVVPTVLVGLLPTYHQIGWVAPATLIILRALQGISVGGQLSGLITIAVDDAKKQSSFLVSMVLAIAILGTLLASLVSLFSQYTVGYFSKELAWRVPFVLSGVLFTIYLKLYPRYDKHAPVDNNFKFSTIFKDQPYEMLYMTILAAAMACIYYILFSYFVTYLQLYVSTSKAEPLIAMNAILIISLFIYPLAGKKADQSLNRIKLSKNFTLIFCLSAVLLSVNQSFSWVILCFLMMTIAYCVLASYLTGMFAEIFEPKYRMTACSLCYSGGAVLGGFSPLISEVLVKKSVGGFFIFLLCLGFVIYVILDKIITTDGYKRFLCLPSNALKSQDFCDNHINF